ncbi:hypothetical protein NHQ30_009546 [Ciborinia camelliae]|nr:hypothetical protein NHQ30_009546 [Ciborinia camelliae]
MSDFYYTNDSLNSSSAKNMGDKSEYQLAPPTPLHNLPDIGATVFTIRLKRPRNDSQEPAGRTIGSQSGAPCMEVKNPRKMSENSIDSSKDSCVDDEFKDSGADYEDSALNDDFINQASDEEESDYDMEENNNRDYGMAEVFELMRITAEREETRGDTFLDCCKCGNTFDYSHLSLWLPGYQHTLPKSLQMTNEYTHPQIVRCPGCDAENCMGCEKSPHDECCSFAHARTVWHALCAVDDAIVQYRKQSSCTKNTKSLDTAVVKALNTLLEHIPKDSTASFGYRDLLRKSMLLDQVAVTIGNMTAENKFDTICLQSWAFINMLSQRSDLYELLFEERLEFLRNMSPGIRVLGFPIAFFPIERTYDADRYAPRTYRIWSLIQESSQCAREFLSTTAPLNDAWPAVIMARNIINVHDDLRRQQWPPSELVTFAHGQELSSFAARLEEMHRVEGTEYGAVHGNIRVARTSWSTGKRGQDQVRDQDNDKEDMRGKRRKTTS